MVPRGLSSYFGSAHRSTPRCIRDEPFDARLPPRLLRRLCLAQAVADLDEASGDASALAQQEHLPGSSPLLRRGLLLCQMLCQKM